MRATNAGIPALTRQAPVRLDALGKLQIVLGVCVASAQPGCFFPSLLSEICGRTGATTLLRTATTWRRVL